MHLTQVHMENFKSFGRKLTVPFEPGFTAITGPNGSGKSNIGDAILFVLGPNSPRAIRAGRLTDLIFNGAQAGKPAAYCLVSLTFDNRDRTMPIDADDVVLTRKVKRTPRKDDKDAYASYFYVNDRASKKREFVDLLEHARISADGYNITQQGDVLHVCQMSNVERRKIIDDLAGVTAFDRDIDAAAKRRGEVEENLERIGIVLDEIGRSLKQLEKEKEAAQRYKDLHEQVQRTKALMAHRRRVDLEAQIADVQRQLERFTTERAELEQRLRDFEGTFKEAQADFAELEQQIRAEGGEEVEKLQEDIKAARDRMVRFEEKIAFAKQELVDAREEVVPLQGELRRAQKEFEKVCKTESDCAAQHEQASTALTAAKAEFEQVQEALSKSNSGAMELKQELGRLKHEHEEKETELHKLRLQQERLTEKTDLTERRIQEAETELETAAQDAKETAWQADELRKTSDGSGKKRKEAERRLFELRKAQAEFARQNEELEGRIRRLQRELAELQAKQDAAARFGGAGRAVDDILSARDRGEIRGVVGTIAELASVEDDYQTALETAAGANLQAIVVEDDAVAAQCIELIKRNKSGRAKLLPLNKLVPGRPRGQALMKVKQQGCLGFALDLIDYNPRYQNAFWNVLGDTLVVQNMNTGRSLMGGVRMVTLQGELFEASGAMIGGSAGGRRKGAGFQNTDRAKVDETIQAIAEAEAAQGAAVDGLSRVRGEMAKLQEELDAFGRGGVDVEERLKELDKRGAHLAQKQKMLVQELEGLRTALAQLEQGARETDGAAHAIEERLAEMERVREEKGKLLLKGGRKDLREKAEDLEKRIRTLMEEALQAENRRDVAAKQKELVAQRVGELEQALRDRQEGSVRYEDEVVRYTEALGKAQAEVDALLAMERKATANLKGLRDRKDACYQKLVDLKSKMDKVSDRMETHYGLISNAKAKLPGLEEQLGEAMVELAEHPLEVTEETVVPAYDELRRTLRNAEAAIDRLGAVNMRALEEFETQSERQQNLTDETERLQDQRRELIQLVEEITQKKKTALMEVFAAINTNFAEVYARLSLGGKAYMELENPDAPFEGGLILKAQPMGKRVTRLDALSGGEKSLTSMAFIFALQMYEPSPFYYLDEVDQNLDAVNSELLAKLVKDNSRFAQFIVVSLRKITLKEADDIFGVTQSQPGLSEMISHFDIGRMRDDDSGEPVDNGDGTTVRQRRAREHESASSDAPPAEDKSKETLTDAIKSMVGDVEIKE